MLKRNGRSFVQPFGMKYIGLVLALAASVSCNSCKRSADETSSLAAPNASPSALPQASSPPSGPDAGAPCHRAADCSSGQSCFFDVPGCTAAGVCGDSAQLPSRACNQGIPMCSCERHVTFYGAGGCAGQGVKEPWERYGCPCTTDAECRGDQRCVPAGPGARPQPGPPRECGGGPCLAKECRDPKP